MKMTLKIALFVSALLCVGSALDSPDQNKTEIRRTGRNYDKTYKFPKNHFGDTDSDEDYSSGTDDDQPVGGYNGYKGYASKKYQPFAPNYNHVYPGFKGGFKFPSGQVDPSFFSMMTALNKPEEEKEGGFLSKLTSDPKSLTIAALIPLSLILVSVLPTLLTYFNGGMQAASNVVQTTATTSSRDTARNGYEFQINYEKVLENIAEIAMIIGEDDCLRKTVCKVASGDTAVPGSEYIKRASRAVASLVSDDWASNIGVKDILDGVKENNCRDVCNMPSTKSRNLK